MKHPPKLIQLLQKQDFIFGLFNSFDLNNELVKQHTQDGPNTRIEKLFFGLHKAVQFRIYVSPYFNQFLLEFGVESEFIFDNADDFCTNEFHTRKSAWLMSGKVTRSYFYIEEDTLTNIMINKTAENYVGIRVYHTTKEVISKVPLNVELTIEGVLRIGKHVYQINYKEKQSFAPGELEAIRKWKNIELMQAQGKIHHLAQTEIYGLYRCALEENENGIHIIYLNEELGAILFAHQLQDGPNRIKLTGSFKRYNDHALILKSIKHIDL